MTIDYRHNQGPPLEHDEEGVDGPYARSGYIKIGRDLRWHHLVGFGKTVSPADDKRGFVFSRAEAWQDLIMECRYKAGTVTNKGVKMRIEPGQLLGAISWLANRWNWTPKTVRVFLDALERDGMIERSVPLNIDHIVVDPYTTRGNQRETDQKNQGNRTATGSSFKGNHSALVTICNYELYQFIQRVQGQPNVDRRFEAGQPNVEAAAKEGQHLKKEIKDIITHVEEGGLEGDAPRFATARAGAPQGSNVVQLPMQPYQTLAVPATMQPQPQLPIEVPQLPAPEKPKKAKKARERKPVVLLPDDWRLPASYGEWALATFAVTRDDILREAQKFRDHWLAKGEGKADWFATWRNWCSSDYRRWTLRPGASKAIAEEDFGNVVDVEAEPVDPWEAVRVEDAKRRAEAAE